MADTFDNRRRNLRLLIEQWGGPKPLSDKLGYSNSSFMVQMAGPNPTREVTEKTARRIEQTLDLPPGWLDAQPREQTGLAPVDMTLIATVIRVVAQSAEDDGIRLSPSKLGDLVAVVYQDAETHNNVVRPEFVNQVLRLVK